MIPIDILQTAWPWLAVLLYMLVTSILCVLGAYQRQAIRLHDLVRESKLKRMEYVRIVAEQADRDSEAQEVSDRAKAA